MPENAPTARLTSLDVLRGFVIASMLFVNNPGRRELTPGWLDHASWGVGITFADLVMPWFLFVIGVSLPFWVERSAGRPGFWSRVTRRALTLIGLGILLVSSAQHRFVIGLDVLQHLGIAGFLATVVYVQARRGRPWIILALLVSHWLLLRFVPAPGVPAGTLEPDRNIVAWINSNWLAPLHLAGLISPVATTSLVLLGSYAGEWLRAGEARRLVLAGAALASGGWIWHYDLFFSKALWTAPYLCFSGGLGMLLLALCHRLFDPPRWAFLASPWIVFGRNAILAYFGAIMLKHHTVEEWQLSSGSSVRDAIVDAYVAALGGPMGSVAWTLTWLAVVWLICFPLYRRRLYWRV